MPEIPRLPPTIVGPLLLTALILLAAVLLSPGLRGTFIFDDFANLQGLGAGYLGTTSAQFITESSSGPLGRPVAMASFWLQADCWPESPVCFKLVNLGLHLLNGVLIYFLVSGLLQIARYRKPFPVALFVTALWLLHPIHASTVFYVIQRMNLLAVTFTLLGLIAWLRTRAAAEQQPRGFLVWGFVAFPAALLLAAMSKENGLLLIAYVAAIELCLPVTVAARRYRVWQTLFLFAPIALVAIGLLWQWQDLVLNGYAKRPFTFEERLLTQLRVVVDYLQLIVAPSGSQIGLFKEGYALSTGLLTPPSTLISAFFIATLTILAITVRKHYALLALGWLWFLAGHAMESTVFPVEIYFEHRNYLPSLGPLLVVVLAGAELLRKLHTPLPRRITQAAFIIYLVYIAALASVEARIWGNPLRQAAIWATENPGSPRAQLYLANVLFVLDRKEEAIATFERLAQNKEDPLVGWMSWFEARCTYPDLQEPPLEKMRAELASTPLSIRPTNTLTQIVNDKFSGECRGVSPDDLRMLSSALLDNPAYVSGRASLRFLLARIEALDHNFETALSIAIALYEQDPDADLALQIAAWQLEVNRPRLALKWLEEARRQVNASGSENPGIVRRLKYIQERVRHALTVQE